MSSNELKLTFNAWQGWWKLEQQIFRQCIQHACLQSCFAM